MSRAALIVPAFFFAACAETVAQPPAPPVDWRSLERRVEASARPMQKERAVTEVYLAALASPGFAALGGLVDEAAHFTCGPLDTHGRERVVAAHEAVFGPFDRRTVVLNRTWLGKDQQAVEWTLSGVHAREWMGVAPTQQPIVLRGLTLLSTNGDHSISNLRIYFAAAGPAPAGKMRLFEQTASTRETRNASVMRALVHALEDDQEAEFLSLLSVEIEAFGGHGRDHAREWFRTMRRALGQLDTVIENAWGVEDFVILEYSISGRQLASLPGIPLVRDRILHIGAVALAELHDGKITSIWRYDAPGALAMETRLGK